jgi:hypothetical protein
MSFYNTLLIKSQLLINSLNSNSGRREEGGEEGNKNQKDRGASKRRF